jgi:hypothetical protein
MFKPQVHHVQVQARNKVHPPHYKISPQNDFHKMDTVAYAQVYTRQCLIAS